MLGLRMKVHGRMKLNKTGQRNKNALKNWDAGMVDKPFTNRLSQLTSPINLNVYKDMGLAQPQIDFMFVESI